MNVINTLPATLAVGLLLALALLLHNVIDSAPLNAEPAPGASSALVISTVP